MKTGVKLIKALLQSGIHHENIPFEWESLEDQEEKASKILLEHMLNTPELAITINSAKSAQILLGEDRGSK